MSKLQNVLASNLKRLRILKGVSQERLAEIIDVAQKTISNLEVEDQPISPKLNTIEKVAQYFGLHPSIMLMDGITDDALTDESVKYMCERFAALPPHRKQQIMGLIDDFAQLES